jgi:hypothetical protein
VLLLRVQVRTRLLWYRGHQGIWSPVDMRPSKSSLGQVSMSRAWSGTDAVVREVNEGTA